MSSTRNSIAALTFGLIASLPACSRNNNSNQGANQAQVIAQSATATIPNWVTAEAGPSKDCPLTTADGTPDNPFFAFNGTTDATDFHCRETGPFDSGGKTWFVQRIHSLTTTADNPMCAQEGFSAPCLFDGTRVCSAQASTGDQTPAGSAAGGKGCGVYAASAKLRKKP
jgi:hypothetical protein